MRTRQYLANRFGVRLLAAAVLSGSLAACGGGSGSTGDVASALRGSVGDGPISGAVVTVTDKTGRVVATTASDDRANYRVELPDDTVYPVIITAEGGTDMVTGRAPDFVMHSATFSEDGVANINPFSTVIVESAGQMEGGLTAANVAAANAAVLSALNFGVDANAVSDPIAIDVNGKTVAGIVKASEALAETIRRIASSLAAAGVDISEDEIIDSIGADLVDGVIDGIGGQAADARIAALNHIVSAQVLIETIANRLKVDGNDATARLDSAIQSTVPGAEKTTLDLGISARMKAQIATALSAAETVSGDANLGVLRTYVEQLAVGTTSREIARVLGPETAYLFEPAINEATTAGATILERANEVVRNQYTPDDTTSDGGDAGGDATAGGDTGYGTALPEVDTYYASDSGSAVTVDLLGDAVESGATASVLGQPAYGTVTIDANGQLTYEPDGTFFGTVEDTVSYSVTDADGNVELRSMTIAIECGDCGPAPTLKLSWNANAGQVLGYRIYSGTGSDVSTHDFLDEVPVDSGRIDQGSPAVSYAAVSDLGLRPGDTVCFSIRAYNDIGESEASEAVCRNL